MTPRLPNWVQKRDGRREPFDADKISQSIFAATEAVGAANAFLARELTDGVLHFLQAESDVAEPTTAQIAELVEKVVRELGQPALALAYLRRFPASVNGEPQEKNVRPFVSFSFSIEDHPLEVRNQCLRAYSLNAVFGRDLAAAHQAELLELSGLSSPQQLEAIVVEPPQKGQPDSPWSLGWSQVKDASSRASRLVVDSPELLFAAHGPAWLEGIHAAHIAYQRVTVFNLRMATRPAWANELAVGPLFAKTSSVPTPTDSDTVAMLHAAECNRTQSFLFDWHLEAKDFEDDADRQAAEWLLARPKLWSTTTFVFDRSRQPEGLAVGIDRSRPATLLRVGLHLSRFLRLPEIAGDPDKLLAKLPSFMRMAVSAGVQKRNYLRRHCPELSRGFLLDRARLVVEPGWLDEAVHDMVGVLPHQSKPALDVARRIMQTLTDSANRDGRASSLDVVVALNRLVHVKAPATEMTAQLQTGSDLLNSVHDGALHVVTPPFSADELWRRLEMVWRTPNISRLRILQGDWSSCENGT